MRFLPVALSAKRVLLPALLGIVWLAGFAVRSQAAPRRDVSAIVAEWERLEKTPEARKYLDACLPTFYKTIRTVPPECIPLTKGGFSVDFFVIVSARGIVEDTIAGADPISPCYAKHFTGITLPKPPRDHWPVRVYADLSNHHEPGLPETVQKLQKTFAEAKRLSDTPAGRAYAASCEPTLLTIRERALKECAPLVSRPTVVEFAVLVAADGGVLGVVAGSDPLTTRAAVGFRSLTLPKPPRGEWPLEVRLTLLPR